MFKKFCIAFLCITLALLTAAGAAVYVIDPFNVYRAEENIPDIIYQMPYYQNIGLAKNAKYDTLITGTSMTQNFRANLFDEKLGCRAIRLSFDGGIVSDFEALLKTAAECNPDLKTVYFGLDNYLITADSKLNSIDERIPDYQIDGNPLTDVQYLLNKDVIFSYIPTYFAYKNSADYNFYDMNSWDVWNPEYSKSVVLKSYGIPEKQEMLPADSFRADCDDFLNAVGGVVKNNPKVDFVFFAPPYSVLYWHTLLQKGTFEATLKSLDYVYGELLQYPNVRIFYFQNDFDRISNLDCYKDANHYCTDYNLFMLDCFADGAHEVTAADYKSVLADMKAFALSCDFDSLMKEKESLDEVQS